MEESLEKLDITMAAPMIFFLVSIVQFINRYIEVNKKVCISIFSNAVSLPNALSRLRFIIWFSSSVGCML